MEEGKEVYIARSISNVALKRGTMTTSGSPLLLFHVKQIKVSSNHDPPQSLNMIFGYGDTPLIVTLLPFPEGVTVSGHVCNRNQNRKTTEISSFKNRKMQKISYYCLQQY